MLILFCVHIILRLVWSSFFFWLLFFVFFFFFSSRRRHTRWPRDWSSDVALPISDSKRHYINETGTGNTFSLTHLNCIRFVADSLRYWVKEMGVDGFRFDLGTILAREEDGFHNDATFLRVCRQDPVLSHVKLIAEPWDVGPGGYQVGNFPPGWAEWNDTFRDTVRDFWRGEAKSGALAPRLLASPDRFNHSGRQTWASVNFVTAHDGFTLMDCVPYNENGRASCRERA